MNTIAALFPTLVAAHDAVEALHSAGVPRSEISIVSHHELHGLEVTEVSNDASRGALAGMVGGAAGGVVAAVGLAAIPGIGWALAAGPVAAIGVSLAAGAATGAVTSGLAGALTETGVAVEDASLYAEAVRRGGTVVIAVVASGQMSAAAEALDLNGPVDLDKTAKRWLAEGWALPDHAGDAFHGRNPTAGDEVAGAYRIGAQGSPLTESYVRRY